MVLAAVVAFIAGAIAGLGPAFSVGGMQFLLVAAIAMGVPHVNWWTAIGLYVVGALFYAALLAAEMLINPRRPQRIVTVSLLQALADLAAARTSDLADGGDRTTEARRRATGAYQAAVGRAAELTARPSWSTRVWVLDGQALTAADRTQAFLVAETDPVAASVAADHLAALAAEVEATGLRCRGKDRGKNGDNATPHGSTSAPSVTSRTDQKYVTTTTPPSTPGPYADGMLGRSVDELAGALNRPADPRSASRLDPHVSPHSSRTRPADHRASHRGTSRSQRAHEPLLTSAFSNEVLMAACRLSLAYGIAVGAKMYFPFSHWFWVPLTVCLVMKPDFGSVFSRAVLRVVGTAVGAVIATVILLLVPKGWAIGVAIGLLSACVPYFMMRSYALQAVAIAPAVILLVDVIQPGDETANFSVQRIGATIVGGLVVLVFGYLIWPHSRRVWIANSFATAMDRIAEHLRLASQPIPDVDGRSRRRHLDLVAARRASYRALADLQFRLRRALAEPGVGGRTAAAWIPAVSAADRLADAVTSYAGRRREGLLPTAPHAGAELARDIATLGGGAGGLGEARWDGEGCEYGGAGGNGEPQMATGPARRNGDGPGDTGTDFDLGLTPIRDQLAHLETLVGVPPEGVTQKGVAPEER